jgi:hypothetical protein
MNGLLKKKKKKSREWIHFSRAKQHHKGVLKKSGILEGTLETGGILKIKCAKLMLIV